MNSKTNAEKVVSEKDGLVKHNIKVEPSNDFKPKKNFVKLVSKDDGKTFYKQEIVKHDDVRHGFNDENSRHAYELIKKHL